MATARIDDPRIVKVYDVGEANGQCYLVMELVEGHSLHEELELLRDPSATTMLARPNDASGCRKLAGFFADIAEALQQVHEQGVLHRDIQPKNILIDRHGKPRVIDFGLARIVDQPGLTHSGEVVGTPCYMSPEQVRAERLEIDRRTDVYSLAVVVYEALVGERAFAGSTTEQVLARIMRVDPPRADRRNAAVPAALAIVCQKAMSKDLSERFDSIGEFAAELRRVERGEAIATRPLPWWRTGLHHLRGHRTTLLASGLAVVAAALLILLLAALDSSATVIVAADSHARATVICQRMDPLTWQPTSTERLGTSPLSCSLDLGQYRLWIVQGDAFAEQQLSVVTKGHEYRVPPIPLKTVDSVRSGMASIAAATFRYGHYNDRYFGHGEQQATVGDYLIDEAEVSNAEFRAYVLATGNKEPSLWPDDWETNWDSAWDDLPVAGTDYSMASSYAAWVGKRLPTSRERMYAATGPDDRVLPWRVDFDREEALARTTMGRVPVASGMWGPRWASYLLGVVPVRSMADGRSAFGLFHTLGNVCEWTETIHIELVDGLVHPVVTWRKAAEPFRDLDEDEYLTVRHMGAASDDTNFETIGFRCAKSLRPPIVP